MITKTQLEEHWEGIEALTREVLDWPENVELAHHLSESVKTYNELFQQYKKEQMLS